MNDHPFLNFSQLSRKRLRSRSPMKSWSERSKNCRVSGFLLRWLSVQKYYYFYYLKSSIS